ncbi:Ketosteroid isomerase-related protein [Variovorax sp. HW608]|uniref:nuclear transport factor 2 family protein n=1 Tax=Variovorax sp. HW608 TaxID=1034889 RepID=UPI0008201E98|nr:nuclear transport factor 2 family protein [Variovorax sp. HW608]SCK14904.1 Ketosteroid isomerase-related protein [Variovorax sp. HW608]
MAHTTTEQGLIEIAREYFRRVDAGRGDLVELFNDDIEVYFPKFGVVKGKQALFELASGLFTRIAELSHDQDSMLCVANGDDVVVEGLSRGKTKSGVEWAGGKTPTGRFCNVFHFRGEKIDRVHIHLDPDYGSEDRERFLWGMERSW